MFFLGQFVSSSLHTQHGSAAVSMHANEAHKLRDFTRLDDAFELLHDEGPNPHWRGKGAYGQPGRPTAARALTLFADETVIAVVRVVGVAQTAMRVLELQELVAVLARVSGAEKKISHGVRARLVMLLTSICELISVECIS